MSRAYLSWKTATKVKLKVKERKAAFRSRVVPYGVDLQRERVKLRSRFLILFTDATAFYYEKRGNLCLKQMFLGLIYDQTFLR